MQVDLAKLNELVDQKYLTRHKHPTADLLIWNYSPVCQFEKFWTPETLMCRGLITDLEGHIKARPFKKFFNYEEHLANGGAVPAELPTVYDKLDGSLGILYWVGDEPFIATRGSFISEQAIKGNEILQKMDWAKDTLSLYGKSNTLLFEIIYPENRIVVDYGKSEALVLLAAIDNETGVDCFYAEEFYRKIFNSVNLFDKATPEELMARIKDNAEGYVMRWDNGLRLKVKFAEYKRLHRILTGINERRIWEILMADEPMDAILDKVPDEFFLWVKETVAKLKAQFSEIEEDCFYEKEKAREFTTRKEQAAIVSKFKYASIVFAMLDNKDYTKAIWQLIKPAATKPFKNDEV